MCYFSLSSMSSPKIENWKCHSMCHFYICSVSFPKTENWKLVLYMPLHVLSLPLPCVFPLQQNCTTYVNIFLRIIPTVWGIKVKRLKKRVWQPFFSLLSWKCISLEIWKPFPTNSATSSEKVQNSVTDISQKMTILSNQIAGALGQRNPNVTYESFEFDKNRTEFRRILEQVSGDNMDTIIRLKT